MEGLRNSEYRVAQLGYTCRHWVEWGCDARGVVWGCPLHRYGAVCFSMYY